MDEQKEKQNAKKKRSTLPIYAIGAVWLLYAKKLDSFRGYSFLRGRVADRVCDFAHCDAREKVGRTAEDCRAGTAPAKTGRKEARAAAAV